MTSESGKLRTTDCERKKQKILRVVYPGSMNMCLTYGGPLRLFRYFFEKKLDKKECLTNFCQVKSIS